LLHLLAHPDERASVERTLAAPNAIEESLRLEPAAAVIDRYATARRRAGGAPIARGDLVRLSIAGANRDPAVFPDPDRFDVRRENARLQIAFAHGPHVCLGMHLARSRRTPRSGACSSGCPACGSTRTAAPRRAGSCSASRPRCTSCGARLPSVILDGRSLTPKPWRRWRVAASRSSSPPRRASATRPPHVRSASSLAGASRSTASRPGSARSGRDPVPEDQRGDQQLRLLRSHASAGARAAAGARPRGDGGAGEPDRSGRRGRLGADCSTRWWTALNAGVTPVAHEIGSLGTGDLTVLAEIALALIERYDAALGRATGSAS
jgi:hypothetical protein